MTDADAIREARVTYDSARRRHEREALVAYHNGRPLTAYRSAAAARRLQRYGPGELIVVREIG